MTVNNSSPGNYWYTAIAQDRFGNRGTSGVVNVLILPSNSFAAGETTILPSPMAGNTGNGVFCEFTSSPGDALIESLSVYGQGVRPWIGAWQSGNLAQERRGVGETTSEAQNFAQLAPDRLLPFPAHKASRGMEPGLFEGVKKVALTCRGGGKSVSRIKLHVGFR